MKRKLCDHLLRACIEEASQKECPALRLRCQHNHHVRYHESSSFLRLRNLPEVGAFGWKPGWEAFRHSIDATDSLVVSRATMERWKRHEQGLVNGRKEL